MQWPERIDVRTAELFASLQAALPTRVVKRNLEHFQFHPPGELEQGVVMLISDGEGNYNNKPRRTATEGTHSLLIIAHLQVGETDTPLDVELAEMVLMEELKSWLRAGLPNYRLELDNISQSRQLEFPYGWIVAKFTAQPLRTHNAIKEF